MFTDTINILQWNLRGYRARLPYLQKIVDELMPNIICLQETKLNSQYNAKLKSYQYPPARKERFIEEGGGG